MAPAEDPSSVRIRDVAANTATVELQVHSAAQAVNRSFRLESVGSWSHNVIVFPYVSFRYCYFLYFPYLTIY